MSGFFDNNNERFKLPKMYGITVGVVSSLEDTENLGRVKVKFLNFGKQEYETDFIRILSPMVGKDFGMQFLPEVGDEVLIGFCEGNLEQPYVLGCLYNSQNKYPSPMEGGKNDIRMIKTKSGHTITFGDKEGEENIEIKSAKNSLSIKIDDKEQAIKISDKDGKNFFNISGKDGKISITAEKEIELVAEKSKITLGGGVKIESDKGVEINGQKIAVEGKSTVEVKGSSGLTLESSGQTVVKGAMVKIN